MARLKAFISTLHVHSAPLFQTNALHLDFLAPVALQAASSTAAVAPSVPTKATPGSAVVAAVAEKPSTLVEAQNGVAKAGSAIEAGVANKPRTVAGGGDVWVTLVCAFSPRYESKGANQSN